MSYLDDKYNFLKPLKNSNLIRAGVNKDGGFVNNLCFVSSNGFCVDFISYFVKILLVFVFDLRNFYLKNILSCHFYIILFLNINGMKILDTVSLFPSSLFLRAKCMSEIKTSEFLA